MDLVPLPSLSDPAKRRLFAYQVCSERDLGGLGELLGYYLRLRSTKRERISEATLRSYRQGIKAYINWIWPDDAPGPLKPLLKVDSDDLAQWLASSGLKPASQALYLSAVLRLYQALKWAGAYGGILEVSSPTDPTPPEAKRKALSDEAYWKLVATLSPKTLENYRDRMAVRLMAEMGLRVSELLGLRFDDVDLVQMNLRVMGKGGKGRVVPIRSVVAEELDGLFPLLQSRSLDGHIFINLKGKNTGRVMSVMTLWRKLSKHYREAGLPVGYSGAHLLRHTAATGMYRRSKDLLGVARILGHASTSTTSIYAKMDQSELRRIIEG